jgi:hypothetical protein
VLEDRRCSSTGYERAGASSTGGLRAGALSDQAPQNRWLLRLTRAMGEFILCNVIMI